MLLRRLVAIVIAFTMLHLSVVSGDAACAGHGSNRVTRGSAARGDAMHAHHESRSASHMAMSHEAHVTATSDGLASPPCETPVQPRCCEGVAGCSATVVITEPASLTSPLPDVERAVNAGMDAPAFVLAAPEPPPPKA